MPEYEGTRRVVYGDAVEGAAYSNLPKCGRNALADPHVLMDSNGILDGPNATCEGPTGCGRISMPFAGFL